MTSCLLGVCLDITGIFAYNDTGFSDSLLTTTLLVNPTFQKSVTVSTYLLTVTLCPGPDGVTVSKYLFSFFLFDFNIVG